MAVEVDEARGDHPVGRVDPTTGMLGQRFALLDDAQAVCLDGQ